MSGSSASRSADLILASFLVGWVGGCASTLPTPRAVQDGPLRIGVVDIDRVISSTEEGQEARAEFARKRREAEAQITPELERYKALEEDLKAQQSILSREALFQRQLDLTEMRNRIETRMKELENQLQVDQRRLEEPLMAKMAEIVREFGREQGFTMILQRGTPGILYVREALDITDLIVERYNR